MMEHFKMYGTIVKLTLPGALDKGLVNKGFAFIIYSKTSEMEAALAATHIVSIYRN